MEYTDEEFAARVSIWLQWGGGGRELEVSDQTKLELAREIDLGANIPPDEEQDVGITVRLAAES